MSFYVDLLQYSFSRGFYDETTEILDLLYVLTFDEETISKNRIMPILKDIIQCDNLFRIEEMTSTIISAYLLKQKIKEQVKCDQYEKSLFTRSTCEVEKKGLKRKLEEPEFKVDPTVRKKTRPSKFIAKRKCPIAVNNLC